MITPAEQATSVILRKNRLFVESFNKIDTGGWVGSKPIIELQGPFAPASVGEAVVRCLNASGNVVKGPIDWDKTDAVFFEATGYKSWGEFMRGAVSCDIRADSRQFILTPTENRGTRGGFAHLNDKAETYDASIAPEELGSAILRILKEVSC